MIGISGKVSDWTDSSGHIFAHGERWSAVSAERLIAGEDVTVIAREGLILEVARKSRQDQLPLQDREESP